MGETPSAPRPKRKRPAWDQLLSLAIGIAVVFGTGTGVANHDPVAGNVVGTTIVILMIISSALVLQGERLSCSPTSAFIF